MPIYQWTCESCGAEDDVLAPIARMDDTIYCAGCGAAMRRVPAVGVPAGVLPSKPLVIKHAGVTLETNAEQRGYEAKLAEEGMRMISANSPEWEAEHRKVREFADKRARQRGFRDWDDSKQQRGKDLARKRELDRAQKIPNP